SPSSGRSTSFLARWIDDFGVGPWCLGLGPWSVLGPSSWVRCHAAGSDADDGPRTLAGPGTDHGPRTTDGPSPKAQGPRTVMIDILVIPLIKILIVLNA